MIVVSIGLATLIAKMGTLLQETVLPKQSFITLSAFLLACEVYLSR